MGVVVAFNVSDRVLDEEEDGPQWVPASTRLGLGSSLHICWQKGTLLAFDFKI